MTATARIIDNWIKLTLSHSPQETYDHYEDAENTETEKELNSNVDYKPVIISLINKQIMKCNKLNRRHRSNAGIIYCLRV